MGTKVITGDEFVMRWAKALGLDPLDEQHATRVVIDAQVRQPLRIYVERVGNEGLLEIVPPSPAEVEIRES